MVPRPGTVHRGPRNPRPSPRGVVSAARSSVIAPALRSPSAASDTTACRVEKRLATPPKGRPATRT
ncbi:hypothetical protein B1H29_06665 [Streptomyces pactum]|uniref:Uncharacterized protein n=1 Tax=Streptomyces pactum TaxID=68249 RepID=A0A1S6J4F2_9ACTN|nr:hypothetical protein B1H29_06665 [Streptomyces pactum]